MHILQLFDPLVMGEDIKVVVTGLPERPLREPFGDGKLKCLQCLRERNFMIGWLAHEQMDMLGMMTQALTIIER